MPPPYHSISVASADSVLRFIDPRKPGLQVGSLEFWELPPLSVCFMMGSRLAQSCHDSTKASRAPGAFVP